MIAVKTELDYSRYEALLTSIKPIVIKSEAEYDRLLSEFEPLFNKSMKDELTTEEEALFDLLATLLEKYEKETMVQIKSDPVGMIKFLMEQQDKKVKDLYVIAPKGRISEILNGKRGISLEMAKKFGEFFHVNPELFIDFS